MFGMITTLSAAAHIVTDYRSSDYPDQLKWRYATYLFKPLTMLLIIAMLIIEAPAGLNFNLVLAALLFSLLGDCFLMLPSKPILPGLSSFLVAHFLYVLAFSQLVPLVWSVGLFVVVAVLLAWGSFIGVKLIPKLGKITVPGVVYFSTISLMVFFAANYCINAPEGMEFNGLVLLLGALLFYVSDSALAFNRFGAPWRAAQFVILSTYFSAQFFIVASVVI